jgi:hypothetical protein
VAAVLWAQGTTVNGSRWQGSTAVYRDFNGGQVSRPEHTQSHVQYEYVVHTMARLRPQTSDLFLHLLCRDLCRIDSQQVPVRNSRKHNSPVRIVTVYG